jgi:broad specificity phosphatase PhoE
MRRRDNAAMSRRCIFITHPNVVISREVPVPRWPLSERGRERMRAGLAQPWVRGIGSIWCSSEQKAIDGAEILAAFCGLPFQTAEDLGENDRSATGFLPPDEFERVADQFFARPHESVRGWEIAAAAQARIVAAVTRIVQADGSDGHVAFVSHGAVGTLLYCHLAGEPISRTRDQPPNGGGNWFEFDWPERRVRSWWQPIDQGLSAAAAGSR